MPDEQHPPRPDSSCAGRQRPTLASSRTRRERSRSTCPERPRLLDPDHKAFAAWFVAYWRGRGAQLFAEQKEA